MAYTVKQKHNGILSLIPKQVTQAVPNFLGMMGQGVNDIANILTPTVEASTKYVNNPQDITYPGPQHILGANPQTGQRNGQNQDLPINTKDVGWGNGGYVNFYNQPDSAPFVDPVGNDKGVNGATDQLLNVVSRQPLDVNKFVANLNATEANPGDYYVTSGKNPTNVSFNSVVAKYAKKYLNTLSGSNDDKARKLFARLPAVFGTDLYSTPLGQQYGEILNPNFSTNAEQYKYKPNDTYGSGRKFYTPPHQQIDMNTGQVIQNTPSAPIPDLFK